MSEQKNQKTRKWWLGLLGLLLLLFFVSILVLDQKNITAESGQDVTLTCRAPKNKIKSVKKIIKSGQRFMSRRILRVADKIITANSRQDVTLTCRAPNNNIFALEWSRADLGDEYVFVYRDGRFVPDEQHPSFKNRVDLQDRQMKDGDVSLILKDVTINDAGTYKCRVYVEETWRWINSIIHLHVDPDQKIITAESGQDVTLTCRAPNNNIIVVEWSRADLGDEYVLVYRDGHVVPQVQHPSFKDRVDLQDRQMKDGDVSLILKDVTINDAGTYECGVVQGVGGPVTLISSINLVIDPPGQTGGSVGLKVGLSVPVVLLLLVAVVGFLIYRKKKLNPTDPHELEHLQHECQKTITAESGQDVTLTCRAPDNNIRVVKWSRADLRDEYVLLYQDGHFVPDSQHPSFKNRVDLQDRQMKDGDVSLILKDVTINDAGTYECSVVQGVGGPVTLISSINLVIDPPGQNNITVEMSL